MVERKGIMAMPKKGRRKIVVDGDTYYYKIREYSNHWGSELTLVVQDPDGKVDSKTFERDSRYITFTPKNVADTIRNGLKEK